MEFSLLCFWKLGNLKPWCCRTCIKYFITMFSLVGWVREILRLSFMKACILDVSCFHRKIISQKVYVLNHHFRGQEFTIGP